MNIAFDPHTQIKNVPSESPAAKAREVETAVLANGGIQLDLSGARNGLLPREESRDFQDVMEEMGAKDVQVSRDYMTVMSNTMSEEDYRDLMQNGADPSDMTPEETVTILDEIKVAVLRGGEAVAGYTDTVDEEALREITGSEVMAKELLKVLSNNGIMLDDDQIQQVQEAVRKAVSIPELTDDMKSYLIRNAVPTDIDHIYLSGHSVGSNHSYHQGGYYSDDHSAYYTKGAETIDREQLRPRLEETIRDAGLEISEETTKEALWLVENGIPCTSDHLVKLHKLNEMEVPFAFDRLERSIESALRDGKTPGKADLLDPRSDYEKVADYKEVLDQATEADVEQVLESGKPLTVRRLAEEIRGGKRTEEFSNISETEKNETQTPDGERADKSEKLRRAELVLQEARLQMTAGAGIRLLKSGYQIEVAPLAQLVEDLKRENSLIAERTYRSADPEVQETRKMMREETLGLLRQIPELPAAVLGRFRLGHPAFTLSQVAAVGTEIKAAYEHAGTAYETLMTAPRADLGDRIEKAFRNVDAILEDLGLGIDPENQKAVRILGYNSLEITAERIGEIKEMDSQLSRVVRAMTPGMVLQMIRDGVNPLDLQMDELEAYLDTQEDAPKQKADKFSKFLYRLERKNEISEEERTSYIGIYRLLRQLEKTDDAAIGRLAEQGKKVTFRGLLEALRSEKKIGEDHRIDDSFGGITAKEITSSISAQIETAYQTVSYYKRIVREAADAMADGVPGEELFHPDQTPEDLRSALQRWTESSDNYSESDAKEWEREQFRSMLDSLKADDEILQTLQGNDLALTPDRMEAMNEILRSSSEWFRSFYRMLRRDDQEEVQQMADAAIGKMTDTENLEEALNQCLDGWKDQIAKELLEQETLLDVKQMQSTFKQMSLLRELPKDRTYHIPVMIDGYPTTLNLELVRDDEHPGQMTMTIESERYGAVAMQLQAGEKLSGYVAYQKASAGEDMQNIVDRMEAETKAHLDLVQDDRLELNRFERQARSNNTDAVKALQKKERITGSGQNVTGQRQEETKDLLKIAQTMLRIMQEVAG